MNVARLRKIRRSSGISVTGLYKEKISFPFVYWAAGLTFPEETFSAKEIKPIGDIKANKNKEIGQAVVAHTFNSSTREAEAGRSL